MDDGTEEKTDYHEPDPEIVKPRLFLTWCYETTEGRRTCQC